MSPTNPQDTTLDDDDDRLLALVLTRKATHTGPMIPAEDVFRELGLTPDDHTA